MANTEYGSFLQWALPRLGLRWAGYRRVRGQVEKRVRRRIAELQLPNPAAYRTWLEADENEWNVLRGLAVVTISRFYRDRGVWDQLGEEVLSLAARQAVAAGDDELRCWSIGCASGEEPYTLSILWILTLAARYPGLRLRILATDVDQHVLARAQNAEYSAATLRDLPAGWRDQAFDRRGGVFQVRARFRAPVELRRQDIRLALPEDTFRVIFCRNLVCTYFEEPLEQQTLHRILSRLELGGFFVLGRHEGLPCGIQVEPWKPARGVYRRNS